MGQNGFGEIDGLRDVSIHARISGSHAFSQTDRDAKSIPKWTLWSAEHCSAGFAGISRGAMLRAP
jgi:hypothetical protein